MIASSTSPFRLTCVAGARPNFMKVAPILEEAGRDPDRARIRPRLVHTGQHYDERMSELFFRELGMPRPDSFLGVGSANHAVQTAGVMVAFDADLDRNPADMVLVVGDVNSTLACALVAAKRGVPVAHVEAGLRSGDRSMPEELNRIATDHLSDLLFTTEAAAEANLLREGIPRERIRFVGNAMIDTLLKHRERAKASGVLGRLGLKEREYAVATLHRPSNVDEPRAAVRTVRALETLAERLPVVFPIHPRTAAALADFGLSSRFGESPNLRVVEPLGYLDFLALTDNARLVLTDSGGVQEETTALGVPCLTFRENTERPVTIERGTNRLVGTSPEAVAEAADRALAEAARPLAVPPDLWDGRASSRILDAIEAYAGNRA